MYLARYMRIPVWIATLAFVPACAHAGAGGSDRNPSPATGAADTARIQVPSNVKGFWVFEVGKTTQVVHRQVGFFAHDYFVDRFNDMRRQACARGWALVVVSEAPPEDITLNGKLPTVHITYSGHEYDGAQIPC